MRDRLINIAIGVVAGIAGALIASGRSASSPASSVERAPPTGDVAHADRGARMAAVVVPPGWDARYLARVDDLAARLDAVEARGEPAPSPTPAPTSSERQQARAAHYRQELATQEQRVADHEREELDPAWASASAARVRAAADALGAAPRAIDCRSRTCVASLRFATPTAGLEFLRSREASQLARGFSGLASTPTPPDAASDYELTIVLDR